jgi:hypothetical protein
MFCQFEGRDPIRDQGVLPRVHAYAEPGQVSAGAYFARRAVLNDDNDLIVDGLCEVGVFGRLCGNDLGPLFARNIDAYTAISAVAIYVAKDAHRSIAPAQHQTSHGQGRQTDTVHRPIVL